MYLPSPSSGGDYTPAPEGSHAAVCVGFVDLGTQPSSNPQYAPRRMVRLTWEIDALMDDGRPYVLGRDYGWSMHPTKSQLRKDLESWRSKRFSEEEIATFDTKNLLRKGCMVGVIHKPSADGSKVYANVGSVFALPRGLSAPPPVGSITYFSLQPDLFEQETFDALPDWLRDKIKQSDEYRRLTAPVTAVAAHQSARNAALSEMDDPRTVRPARNGHGISAPKATAAAQYDHDFNDDIPF